MHKQTKNNGISSPFLLVVGIIVATFFMVLLYVDHKKKNALQQAQKVYAALDRYRVTYDIDARGIGMPIDTISTSIIGIDQCVQNIQHFVDRNQQISMLLVGFPFKSANQEKKVNGFLPDMAERKSLEYVQHMLDDIKKVYVPGARMLIFCDGILFAQLFGIPLEHVVAYERALKLLSKDLPDITIFSSEDMMRQHNLKSHEDIIAHIDQYEPNDAAFRSELKQLPETALKRIALDLDHTHGRKLLEKNSLEEIVTQLLSREARLRSYIAKNFSGADFFRLSVRYTTDVSQKFGIKLSPSSDITPFHGVMVQDGDTWSIRFKKDIDTQSYIYDQTLINGRKYGYYKAK